jgi:hypothetical protein
MTGKAPDSSRHRPFSGLPTHADGRVADTEGRPGDQTGDELVRILTRLTADVERFDSFVAGQRRMLEQRSGNPDGCDDAELIGQSERITLEAADMLFRARYALEQLRRLGEPARLPVHFARHERARRLVRNRQTG